MSPKRLISCVSKVKKSGSNVNPYAVCVKSTGQKPHKKKRGR